MPATAHPWLDGLIESASVRALTERLAAAPRVVAQGSRGSSTHLLAGAVARVTGRPVVLVVAHLDEADDALDDLNLFSEAGHALTTDRFGALEVLPGESNVSLELLAERLSVVQRISGGELLHEAGVLVAPIQALMQSVPEPGAVDAFSRTLSQGDVVEPVALSAWLTEVGYQRQEAIEQPGDFAVRGGIVDIYPPAGRLTDRHGRRLALAPVRLDFFGDEIDRLHTIDLETMGSTASLERVQLIGASSDHIQAEERTTDLLSLLPAEAVVMLHEPMELAEQARGYFERLTDPRGMIAPQALFERIHGRPHIEVNQYSPPRDQHEPVVVPVDQLPPFDTEAQRAVKDLGELAREDQRRVVVLCEKSAERDRLRELLDEHVPEDADRVRLEVGYLHRGFVWKEDAREEEKTSGPSLRSGPACADSSEIRNAEAEVHLIPHHELFHRYDLPSARRRVRQVAAGMAEQGTDAFLDLEPGDYVVHVDHGIARFAGLRTMRRDGVSQEFLTLEFAQSAKLHVPATQIELVQKYVGGFEGRPPLSHLGGKRWQKQKEQVREAVKDLAKQLLQVQATRATQPGIRYPADTPWQREFEAEFPYDETEDQLAAVAAVKADMNEDRPADRLICGDVGFGKTEVAVRAAFKAAEYGKQVAVLVPTTVLAEQHERTFRQRMADYPFIVESISRFKTGGEQAKLIERLKTGEIDIVIGTHRLLSKDVKFADLGLVIVDEEQRFGVEHKQKLLEFRLTTDVLTLTATPIPRTLHMSMVGLRDISSLSTPPMERRAIVTEVIPYDRPRIKQALLRELNREGQAFFVHNRVHNIQSVAAEVQQLVPEARVVYGHGQMTGHELEKVMLKFLRHEADILVCTTIIESGIDIPNANTMVINQADQFGLADLHQLRGRVGRYKHRAYCYLLLPPDRPVTDVAAKRLKAIEQYSMLGAGFRIAMRDLEIRGAGNLLGPEQSGHIAAVGYEMYCTLLDQETRKLKHEPIVEPAKTHLELPINGALPKKYIGSDKFRMAAYRQLSRASTPGELDQVVTNLVDAYGKPPAPAQRLIDLTELRIAASTLEIEVIRLEAPDIIFKVNKAGPLDELFRDAPGRVTVLDERTLYYRPPASYLDPPDTLLAVLRKLLVRPVREREREREASEVSAY